MTERSDARPGPAKLGRVRRRAQAAARQLLSYAHLIPSVASHQRTLASFDAVPGVEVQDADALSDTPRFVEPRTVQQTPYQLYKDIADERRPARDIRVARVPRGRLMDDGGVVVAEDGSLVLESLWDEEHFQRDYCSRTRVPPPVQLEGTYASLVSLWSDNYFHWMFDCLPRLAVLEAVGHTNVPLIVPEGLRPWQRETLARLGVSASRQVPFQKQHVQAEQLIWAAAPSYISFATPKVVRWLRERLVGSDPVRGQRRLYVRRVGSRRVANEPEVMRVLDRHGFEVAEPERMTLGEQITTFSQAQAIIAVHGAALANSVFARQPAVLELFQPGFYNTAHYVLAGAGNCDYWYLVCEPAQAARNGRSSKDSDVVVPIRELERTVAEMLAEG